MANELRRDSPIATKGKPGGDLPVIDAYEVLERIGRGGMGEVFVARQIQLDRLVAIKFLLAEHGDDPGNDLVRFRREAELMAKVSHPNVLSIFDFGDMNGRPYLVMEYVEGGDLRRQMKPGKPMSQQKVRSVVMPVGEALNYLHRNKIIHRDLKPENILLHEGDNPRVSDFGIAVLRAGSGALSRPTQAVGTLGYVAPEQQYRLKVDERADQYSLAALAYEMLTGQLPLGVFKPPSALNPLLSPAVDTAIMKALQENPKARYPTIREFTAALDQTLAPEPRGDRRQWMWAALSLVAIVLSGLSLSGWRPFASPNPFVQQKDSAPPPSPPDAKKPGNSSPLVEKLTRLQATENWKRRGEPKGESQAEEQANWFKAKAEIVAKLHKIAYRLWEDGGKPEGEVGKRVEPLNWEEAQKCLYKEMTGKSASLFDPPEDDNPESK